MTRPIPPELCWVTRQVAEPHGHHRQQALVLMSMTDLPSEVIGAPHLDSRWAPFRRRRVGKAVLLPTITVWLDWSL